jgi:methylmalonyl-CoA mutase cobalamin-binding subunit
VHGPASDSRRPARRRGSGPGGRDATPRSAGKLSIGALSRATDISVETLRTWERRYGYPVPERKPSGHRVYPTASVPRLRRIAQALAHGHRAAEVVTASDADLAELLGTAHALLAPPAPPSAPPAGLDDLLRAVECYDGEAVTRPLLADWARLGPLAFLSERIAPLVRAVGDAWEQGRLGVRHEHFLSERVGDLLRTLRLPLEERARGPLVIVTTLPGEAHGLGVQMVALLLAACGCRVLSLGTETPIPQVAEVAREMGARTVGVSIAASSRGAPMTAQLLRLRSLLPRRVGLLAGGDGAPRARAGVTVIQDLGVLDHWARALAGVG